MQPPPRYFLQEDGRRTGPHSLAVLKQKAEMGLLSADTLLAPEAEPEEWSALRDSQVLHEELLPSRPHYTLASQRPITRVNRPDNPVPPSVEEMLSDNLARQQQAAGELLKPLPARSNRRRSDYLFLLFTGNLLAVLAYVLLRNYPLAFVSLVGFVALYNTAIVWILFFVMSRY